MIEIRKIDIPDIYKDVTDDHIVWLNELFDHLGMENRLIFDDDLDCDLHNHEVALELCATLSDMEIIHTTISPGKHGDVSFYAYGPCREHILIERICFPHYARADIHFLVIREFMNLLQRQEFKEKLEEIVFQTNETELEAEEIDYQDILHMVGRE